MIDVDVGTKVDVGVASGYRMDERRYVRTLALASAALVVVVEPSFELEMHRRAN